MQRKSCIISFFNFVDWIEMISQYDFSSINTSTLHYLFALSYWTYMTERYLHLWKKVELFSFKLFHASICLKMFDHIDHTKFINSCRIKLITLSWVLKFKLNIRLEKYQVELKFFWKSVELNWEVEFKNSNWIEKLDSTIRFENSTQLDKILDRCK